MFDFMDVRGICWLPFFISASYSQYSGRRFKMIHDHGGRIIKAQERRLVGEGAQSREEPYRIWGNFLYLTGIYGMIT